MASITHSLGGSEGGAAIALQTPSDSAATETGTAQCERSSGVWIIGVQYSPASMLASPFQFLFLSVFIIYSLLVYSYTLLSPFSYVLASFSFVNDSVARIVPFTTLCCLFFLHSHIIDHFTELPEALYFGSLSSPPARPLASAIRGTFPPAPPTPRGEG